MTAVIYFKNGKQETFNIKHITIDEDFLEVGLKKSMIRPPCKNHLQFLGFDTEKVKKIEVLNE